MASTERLQCSSNFQTQRRGLSDPWRPEWME
ncbi:uncharacterized protein G2W53_019352 [Senna tora]|uniref:Uncharacterized protein n=1 Tax=Senna tora TaxID=362788 RepID=A0A834TUB4_9FABA|nr:uncharacterized protein G2W53_019352 [Senna tora]